MPASKTKEVRTPHYRESVLSALIRDSVGGGKYGPDWANMAPQGKRTKMRARKGTVFDVSKSTSTQGY